MPNRKRQQKQHPVSFKIVINCNIEPQYLKDHKSESQYLNIAIHIKLAPIYCDNIELGEKHIVPVLISCIKSAVSLCVYRPIKKVHSPLLRTPYLLVASHDSPVVPVTLGFFRPRTFVLIFAVSSLTT